jgi:hypothetical protein
MMPTFAPLPSTAPPALDDDELLLLAAAGALVEAVFFLLELHPVTTSAAATPMIMTLIPDLRMGCHAFRVGVEPGRGERVRPVNVVRANISHIQPGAITPKSIRYRTGQPGGTRYREPVIAGKRGNPLETMARLEQ